jgi:hypothetical protein
VGNLEDGKVVAVIPDPMEKATGTSAAQGVAADTQGNIDGLEAVREELRRTGICASEPASGRDLETWLSDYGIRLSDEREALRNKPCSVICRPALMCAGSAYF